MYSDPFTLWMRKLRPRKVNSQGKQLTGVGVRTQSYQSISHHSANSTDMNTAHIFRHDFQFKRNF